MLKITKVPYEEEKKRNPELKDSDIQILKDWCEKQYHLPPIEDSFLAMFLHSNYYRLEPTKNTIENFFTLRYHSPEFFLNRDIYLKEIRKAATVLGCLPLQMRTKEGYTLFYSKLIDSDASHYDFDFCTKFLFMVTDMSALEAGTTNGFVFVGDAAGVNLGHLGRVTILGIKKLLMYIQEAAPIRLKAIHFLNTVPAMEMLVNMAKPFMKKELIEMLHFHTTLTTFANFVPIEALPNELGGKAGKIMDLQNAQIKMLEDNRDWYLEAEKLLVVDESRRVGKPKSAGDLFGVEGSFRKLEID